MRVLVRDLSPGQKYILQFRSNTGTEVSEWSQKLELQTSNDILAPKAVTGLTAAVNGTAFKVTWNKVTQNTDNSELKDFKDYEVLVTSTSDGQQQTYYVTQNHFDFPIEINQNAFGSPKAKLKFEVRARDINFNAVATYASATAQNPAPAAPGNFSATPVVNGVNLKWAGVADKDVKFYRVYQGTTAGSTTTKVYEGLTTSFTYSSTNFTNQYFRVAAVDIFDQETLVTNAISAAPLAIDGSDTVPPANPTWAADWYTAETDVSNRFDIKVDAVLKWNANTESDLGAYLVRYKKAGDDAWSYRTINGTASTPPATTTKINDLSKGATYQFELAARDKKGNTSSYVAAPTSQMVAGDNVGPDKPSTPIIREFLGQLIVRWDSKDNTGQPMAADTSHVEVHVSTTPDFVPDNNTYRTRIDYSPNGGGEVVVPNLSYGIKYHIKFIAVDYSNNTSPASNQASGTPRGVTGVDIDNLETGTRTVLTEDFSANNWMAVRGSTRVNRVFNASGEGGTTGWDTSSTGVTSLTVSSTPPASVKSGPGRIMQGQFFNIAFAGGGSSPHMGQSAATRVPVTPGQWVSASAHMWVTANRRARLRLLFYNAAGTSMTGTYSDYIGGSTITHGHMATAGPMQVPADAVTARVLVYGYEDNTGAVPATAMNVYVRDITMQVGGSIEEVSALEPITGDGYNYALWRTTITNSHGSSTNIANITNNDLTNTNYYETVGAPIGVPVNVTLDLGSAIYIDRVHVWHYYHGDQDRMYNGTKTEISEDGVTWRTIFDSAVDGKYFEPNDGSGKLHVFGRQKVRYIRDWLAGNNINDGNHWVQIKAFDGRMYWGTGTRGTNALQYHTDRGIKNVSVSSATINGQETPTLKITGTEQWLLPDYFMPLNPNKEYKMSIQVKGNAGNYRFYIGWVGFDQFYRAVNAPGVLHGYGSAHYHVTGSTYTAGMVPDWTELVGYSYGPSNRGSTAAAPNKQLPGVFHQDIKYIKPLILANYQSGSNPSEIEVAMLKVEEISFIENIIGRASIMDASIDTAKVSSLSAGKIATGELSSGTRIIAGPETGQHAEMTAEGFFVKAPDDDGVMRDLVRMGTRTSDFISVPDPEEPEGVLASMSETGAVSATTLNVIGNEDGSGIMLNGEEFLEYIDRLPKGLVAEGYLEDINITNIGDEYGICEISWEHEPGREYEIIFGGINWYSPGDGTSAMFRIRYTNDGSAPTINSANAYSVFTPVSIGSSSRACNSGPIVVSGRFNGGVSTPRTIRALITVQRYYGTGAVTINTYAGAAYRTPVRITVQDIGREVPETAIINRGGGKLTGGVVEPPPTNTKKTYTSVWTANASESYRGNGTARTDTTDLIQGYNSTNGDGHGMVLFTGGATSGETGKTLATALSGATINKVEVYLYANHWYYNAGGTALIKAHSLTSLSSTTPNTGVLSSSSWPKPGGRWVNITSIWSSARRGIWVGKAGTTNLTYYGRFNGHTGSYKPQLKINYTR